MSSPSASRPEEVDAEVVHSLLRGACVEALPNWLEQRRWFADKGRGISGVAIEDALVERVEFDWLALAVARVAFIDGNAARYLLPLALTESAGAADVIHRPAIGAVPGAIVDATEKSWFGGWLLDQFAGATDPARGAWMFTAHAGAGAEIASARNSPTTAVSAEQSNSSFRFGDILIVKLFRRLQPGLNPDEEVLRALAGVAVRAGAALRRLRILALSRRSDARGCAGAGICREHRRRVDVDAATSGRRSHGEPGD